MEATRKLRIVDGKIAVYYHLSRGVRYSGISDGVEMEKTTNNVLIDNIAGNRPECRIYACDEAGKIVSTVPIRHGISFTEGDEELLRKEFGVTSVKQDKIKNVFRPVLV